MCTSNGHVAAIGELPPRAPPPSACVCCAQKRGNTHTVRMEKRKLHKNDCHMSAEQALRIRSVYNAHNKSQMANRWWGETALCPLYVTKSQLAKKQQQKKVLSDATNCFSQRPTRTPATATGDSGNCSPQSNERIIARIAHRSP